MAKTPYPPAKHTLDTEHEKTLDRDEATCSLPLNVENLPTASISYAVSHAILSYMVALLTATTPMKPLAPDMINSPTTPDGMIYSLPFSLDNSASNDDMTEIAWLLFTSAFLSE